MSEFPTLAEVVAKHADTWIGAKSYPVHGFAQPGYRVCTCYWRDGSPAAQFSRESFAEHVQGEWREACTITTVEQLDALPADTIIVDADNWAWQKDANPGSRLWIPSAFNSELVCEDGPELPAYVLHHPDWSKA
ncbi:hypothetical protein [Mycobacterium sp. 48b]|uniref:hypothetical protein n=1 Tax=Mycobacterium sp. 48b TaxID=3400426 RepID=UPI003AAA513A